MANPFENLGNRNISAAQKPELETKPESTPKSGSKLENGEGAVFEISSEEVEKMKELAISEVEDELAVLQKFETSNEGETSSEKLEDSSKWKKKIALAFAALTTFAITSGAMTEKAEAFNVRVNIGLNIPVAVEQTQVYCAPMVVGTQNVVRIERVVDRFGNVRMAQFVDTVNIVQEVCNNVVGNNGIVENMIVFSGSNRNKNNHQIRQHNQLNNRGSRR